VLVVTHHKLPIVEDCREVVAQLIVADSREETATPQSCLSVLFLSLRMNDSSRTAQRYRLLLSHLRSLQPPSVWGLNP